MSSLSGLGQASLWILGLGLLLAGAGWGVVAAIIAAIYGESWWVWGLGVSLGATLVVGGINIGTQGKGFLSRLLLVIFFLPWLIVFPFPEAYWRLLKPWGKDDE